MTQMVHHPESEEHIAFISEKLGRKPSKVSYNPIWNTWQLTYSVPRGSNSQDVIVELREHSQEVRVFAMPLLDSFHPIDDIANAFKKMSKRVDEIPLIIHD